MQERNHVFPPPCYTVFVVPSDGILLYIHARPHNKGFVCCRGCAPFDGESVFIGAKKLLFPFAVASLCCRTHYKVSQEPCSPSTGT